MLIMLALEQSGPLSAAEIVEELKENTGETVVSPAVHATLKNLQNHEWVSAINGRRKDKNGASRLVVVFSLLPAGRKKLGGATKNILSMLDHDQAINVLKENKDRRNSARSGEDRRMTERTGVNQLVSGAGGAVIKPLSYVAPKSR